MVRATVFCGLRQYDCGGRNLPHLTHRRVSGEIEGGRAMVVHVDIRDACGVAF